MPRRSGVPKKEVLPDPKYNSKIITKLINQVMQDGKKAIAQNLVWNAFSIAQKNIGVEPLAILEKVLENAQPLLETKARKIGGATYQVPIEIRPERRQTLAIRWLVKFAQKRGERGMENRLAGELTDAYNNTGATVKRKEEMHRMAEANKAFAHYKW